MKISRSNPTQRLGKYFKASEFFPNDGSGFEFEINSKLVTFLNEIRHRFGEPINVNSAIRSQATQQALIDSGQTTAKSSHHLEGNAVDIDSPNLPELIYVLSNSKDLFDKYSINGVNVYPGYIHVDVRPAPRKHWGGILNFAENPVKWKKNSDFEFLALLLFLFAVSK